MIPRKLKGKVYRIEHKTRAISSKVLDRGLPTQRMETEREELGWFIVLQGNISIYWGPTAPEGLVPGDEIMITLEKLNE